METFIYHLRVVIIGENVVQTTLDKYVEHQKLVTKLNTSRLNYQNAIGAIIIGETNPDLYKDKR